MSDCPVCGADTYWQGGIRPNVCVLDKHPLCHIKAGAARKQGIREGRSEIILAILAKADVLKLKGEHQTSAYLYKLAEELE